MTTATDLLASLADIAPDSELAQARTRGKRQPATRKAAMR